MGEFQRFGGPSPEESALPPDVMVEKIQKVPYLDWVDFHIKEGAEVPAAFTLLFDNDNVHKTEEGLIRAMIPKRSIRVLPAQGEDYVVISLSSNKELALPDEALAMYHGERKNGQIYMHAWLHGNDMIDIRPMSVFDRMDWIKDHYQEIHPIPEVSLDDEQLD